MVLLKNLGFFIFNYFLCHAVINKNKKITIENIKINTNIYVFLFKTVNIIINGINYHSMKIALQIRNK